MGLTVKELASLQLLQKRIPNARARHVRALLCILSQSNSYISIEDIEKGSLIEGKDLQKVMDCLARKKLVEMDGCLYKKPEEEKIAALIECR